VGVTVGHGVRVGTGDGVTVAVAVGINVGDGVAVGVAVTARVGSGPSSIIASTREASYSDAVSWGSSGAHAGSSSASSSKLHQTRDTVRTALTCPVQMSMSA